MTNIPGEFAQSTPALSLFVPTFVQVRPKSVGRNKNRHRIAMEDEDYERVASSHVPQIPITPSTHPEIELTEPATDFALRRAARPGAQAVAKLLYSMNWPAIGKI